MMDFRDAASVILIGGANLDIIGRSTAPMVPRDSNPGRIRFSCGGVCRNIAENLARLGVPVELIAGIGSGPEGTFIRNHGAEAGIGMSHCITRPGEASSAYVAFLDDDGDMAWAVSDMTAAAWITPGALAERSDVLASARIIVADANVPVDSLEYLARHSSGIPIYIDPVSTSKAERLRTVLPGLHTLKMNRQEASAITGMPVNDPEEGSIAARALRDGGVRRVFITFGAEGVAWCTAEGEGFFTPEPVVPVDATGAGDAFYAGLILADLDGLPIDRALRWAAATAETAMAARSPVNPGLSRAGLEAAVTEGWGA